MKKTTTVLPADEAPVILLAEDDPVEAEIIQRAVRQTRLQADLHWVKDGQQAMDYLTGIGGYADRGRFPLPDLILLDLNMPRKTGLEVLEWRNTQAAVARVPVIVVTAVRDDHDIARAFDLGATSYLVKPVTADALQDLISTYAHSLQWQGRVLLIDDNLGDREMAEHQLRREFPAMEISAVAAPEDITRALEGDEFDLVISDFHSPWWTGIQNLRAVKVRYPEVPVIVYSGSATQTELLQSLEAGLDDYVLKTSAVERARLPNAVRLAVGRARQRRALRASEEKYRLLAENAEDWIYWIAPDKTLRYVSPSCERLSGYAPEEFTDHPNLMLEIVHPEDRDTVESHFGTLSDESAADELEFRILTKSGELRWISHSCAPVYDSDGKAAGRRVASRNITERKKSEKTLHESEERYRTLFEQAAVGVALLETETGRYVRVNKKYGDLLGYTIEEMLHKSFQDVTYPDDAQANIDANASLMAGTISEFSIEKRYVRKDGTILWGILTVSPSWQPGTQPENYFHIGVVQDITERKQAEVALRESEERLRAVLNSAPITIFATDSKGMFTLHEGRGLKRVGMKPGENVGMSAFDLYRSLPIIEPTGKVATGEDVVHRVLGGETVLGITQLGDAYFDNQFVPLLDMQGQVAGLVGVSTDVSERKRAEEEIGRRADEFAALYDTTQSLSGQYELPALLQTVADNAQKLLKSNSATMYLYDPASDELELKVKTGFALPVGARLKMGEGLAGRVAQSRQPHIIDDYQTWESRSSLYEGMPFRAVAEVPMLHGGNLIGVLAVTELGESTRKYDEADLRLLSLFAGPAASAVHNARLLRATVRQLDQLQSLRDVDQSISSSFDLRVTLNVILEQVISQLHVDAAAVLLLNAQSQTLAYAGGRGFRARGIEHSRLRLGEGQTGRVALQRHTLITPDLAAVDFVRKALLANEGFVSHIAAPLVAKGQVKGVLEIFQRARFNPDRDWLDFLETLAGQTAIAIDNAQLFENLQHSSADLSIAYDRTIEGWSRALDLRDRETEGHTLRVTEITLRLAKSAGIGDSELVHIRRGALLHDIGKMGVPDGILLKPGKLTDEEWKVMHLHPQLAYDMLSPIAYLKPALDIPYCHHEKWDGTGYPRGLRGEQIPLAARLFAVIDVWDALRSDRPYRAAWTEEKALEHVQAGSGTHFDPQAVELFFKLIREEALGHVQAAG